VVVADVGAHEQQAIGLLEVVVAPGGLSLPKLRLYPETAEAMHNVVLPS
jgi:hypothetical protein